MQRVRREMRERSASSKAASSLSPLAALDAKGAKLVLACKRRERDADGDGSFSTYEWRRGGVVLGTGETLSSGYSRGDTVTCVVTPSDGYDEGPTRSTSVTIGNSAPTVASVNVSPSRSLAISNAGLD